MCEGGAHSSGLDHGRDVYETLFDKTDPDNTLAWYQNIFGGETDSLKDRIDGLRYGGVWLLVSQLREGTLAATQGRALDHLVWGLPDLDAAADEIKGKGVDFPLAPRTLVRLGPTSGPP